MYVAGQKVKGAHAIIGGFRDLFRKNLSLVDLYSKWAVGAGAGRVLAQYCCQFSNHVFELFKMAAGGFGFLEKARSQVEHNPRLEYIIG